MGESSCPRIPCHVRLVAVQAETTQLPGVKKCAEATARCEKEIVMPAKDGTESSADHAVREADDLENEPLVLLCAAVEKELQVFVVAIAPWLVCVVESTCKEPPVQAQGWGGVRRRESSALLRVAAHRPRTRRAAGCEGRSSQGGLRSPGGEIGQRLGSQGR